MFHKKQSDFMTNIREIAKKAGVGIATVSRYINKTGYVSDENRLKIQKIIDESGYTPNALARAIFSKSSKTIGLMIPNIANPFFNQLAAIIEEYFNSHGYTIFLCNTDDSRDKEIKYLEELKSHRVAGIIASRSQCNEEYEELDIPVVSFENHILPGIITVSSDNYSGGRLAFKHLYEKGCRKLLHIKGPEKFEATEQRYQGFIDAARDFSINVDIFKFQYDFHVYMLEEKLNHLSFEDYDGIFVFNDIAAAMVMKHLHEKKILIPEQIQVIGFDNSFIGELLYPTLTTINQPLNELGKLAAELLYKMIQGEEVEVKDYLIKTSLVQRNTTLQ